MLQRRRNRAAVRCALMLANSAAAQAVSVRRRAPSSPATACHRNGSIVIEGSRSSRSAAVPTCSCRGRQAVDLAGKTVMRP